MAHLVPVLLLVRAVEVIGSHGAHGHWRVVGVAMDGVADEHGHEPHELGQPLDVPPVGGVHQPDPLSAHSALYGVRGPVPRGRTPPRTRRDLRLSIQIADLVSWTNLVRVDDLVSWTNLVAAADVLEDATSHMVHFMGEDATHHATDVAGLVRFRVRVRVGARGRVRVTVKRVRFRVRGLGLGLGLR